ncbi:MAG: carboxypeptidase regulatory-like domain-containing protein [Terriglobia bacterium]
MEPHRAILVTLVVAILGAGTWSHSPRPQAQPGAGMHPPTPSSARAASGILAGRVLFAGAEIPQPTQVENTTDPAECGELHSLEDVIISRKNGGIKNVIVAVKGVPLPKGYRPQTSRLVLENRDCRFEPHVAVLTTGSSIEGVNSDPIFHSVHLYGLRNLNLALAPGGAKLAYTVKHPGYIIVKCDIHGWMQAFIRVDEHPFHSVTAADGSFRIEGVPPGSYTLEIWHELFGSQEISVRVEPDQVSRATIYYPAPE